MRIVAYTFLALGIFVQVGCTLALSPTATPRRLQAYNDHIAAQYIAANDFETQGELESARKIYLELHEKHPKNADYLHRLAVVNTRMQRFGEANSYYCRAFAIDPTNPRLLTDMGYTFYITGDLEEAEPILREALRLKPDNHRATNNLALVVGAKGDLNECLALLNSVNSKAESLSCLAYVHAERGELDLAEERYEEALVLDPTLKNAERALAELQKRHPRTDAVAQMLPDTIEKAAEPRQAVRTQSEVKEIIQQASANAGMEFGLEPSQVISAKFEQTDSDESSAADFQTARHETDEWSVTSTDQPEMLSEEQLDEETPADDNSPPRTASNDDEFDWAN